MGKDSRLTTHCRIPKEILIPILNEVGAKVGAGIGSAWSTSDMGMVRTLLGAAYAHVDLDLLRLDGENLRKSGQLKAQQGRNGAPRTLDFSEEYTRYMVSPEWQSLRNKIIAFWDGHCAVCYYGKGTDVHHNNYERLGHERQTDVILVCRNCHKRLHSFLSKKTNKRGSVYKDLLF